MNLLILILIALMLLAMSFPIYALVIFILISTAMYWAAKITEKDQLKELLVESIAVPEELPNPSDSLTALLADCAQIDFAIVKQLGLSDDLLTANSGLSGSSSESWSFDANWVEVSDPRLPHKVVWDYACVDGSRDHRYSQNACRMMSLCVSARATAASFNSMVLTFFFEDQPYQTAKDKVRFLIDMIYSANTKSALLAYSQIYTEYCTCIGSLALVRSEITAIANINNVPVINPGFLPDISAKSSDRLRKLREEEGNICLRIGELGAASLKIVENVQQSVIGFREAKLHVTGVIN